MCKTTHLAKKNTRNCNKKGGKEVLNTNELEKAEELNEILEKLDKTTMLLVKANAELITQNKELLKENEKLKTVV